MDLLKKFSLNIIKNKLILKNTRILLGFSGGIDSTCLFHLLLKLKENIPFYLHIAHINYNFRKNSVKDEQLVKNLCKKNNVDYSILNVHPKCEKENLQNTARKIRYELFYDIIDHYNITNIAIAHNADDQIETMLLQLIRGCGLNGISSMKFKNKNIIRPLLNITRKEILNYLKINNYSFRIDSSNLTSKYKRNYLRNEIIPNLKKCNPSLHSNIFKTSEILNECKDFINYSTKDLKLPDNIENDFNVNIKKLKALHPFIQKQYILNILSIYQNKFSTQLKNYENINSIQKLIKSKNGKKHIIGKLNISKNYNYLTFYIETEKNSEIILKIPGITKTKNYYNCESLKANIISIDKYLKYKKVDNTIFFDYNTLTFPLKLRSRKNGDSFKPFKMNGKQIKLKKFFINSKIPAHLREYIPLLCDNNNNIISVINIRNSELGSINNNTEKILKIEIIRKR